MIQRRSCGAEPEGVERRVHGGDARLRAGLDQCGHRPVDQEPGGELIHAAQQRVELMDPGCDLDRGAHPSQRTPGYGLRARRRLLGEQGLQRLEVRLHLRLIGAVGGVVAGHERCLGGRVVGRRAWLSSARICCWIVPVGVVVGVGDVPGLGDGVGDVDGDGDGDVDGPVPAGSGRPGTGEPLLSRFAMAAANDVPCCTLLWSPTITYCSCGNAVPPLAPAVTYIGRT